MNKFLLDFQSGDLSFGELAKRYDNFYYAMALDGHESNNEQQTILKKYEELISLHQFVQTKVLDLVLADEFNPNSIPEDRISESEAIALLQKKLHDSNLISWNQVLQKVGEKIE